MLPQLLELELMLLLALLTFAPATCYSRPWCACQSLFRELGPLQLLALLVHTLWLASWCRRPHCAILNQLPGLELMLLLTLLTFAPATCYSRPWCACQSLFQELGPLQLLALLVHTPGLNSWCWRPHCAILSQLLELELMLLLALLTLAPATCN